MAADALDEAVRRADPDRWLASRFIADRGHRAGVVALYALDGELARAARIAADPTVGLIRLAWWREALAEIAAGQPPRAQPALVALSAAHTRQGLDPDLLAAMVEARMDILEEPIADAAAALDWADRVGGSLCRLAACVLDPASPAEAAASAGRLWGLLQLRRSYPDLGGLIGGLRGDALMGAKALAGEMTPAAFPAIAHCVLAGPETGGRRLSEVEKRLRLVLAVARGRI